uniref:RING-type domain-containing protein n=1 Tax=Athene cunicularia TaxID=194338 RepID=A0A663MFL2_ATHCN
QAPAGDFPIQRHMEKIRHLACLSCQGKFWGTEEPMEERGSSAKASTSQLLLTRPVETRANYYMACLHHFCFTCIQQWARGRDACPVCRQPFEWVLHTCFLGANTTRLSGAPGQP